MFAKSVPAPCLAGLVILNVRVSRRQVEAVAGVLTTRSRAEEAIAELHHAGFASEHIGVAVHVGDSTSAQGRRSAELTFRHAVIVSRCNSSVNFRGGNNT